MKKIFCQICAAFIRNKEKRKAFRRKYRASLKYPKSAAWIKEDNHVYLIDSKNGVKQEIFNDLDGLHFDISGRNNIIEIYTPIGRFANTTIFIAKSNGVRITFEQNIFLTGCFFSIWKGENQKCFIGQWTSFAGNDIINIHNNSSLYIGTDCMFSNNVDIWCSDGHVIFDDKSKQVLNYPAECLKIGNHCWIGYGAKILKGAGLKDNSILGAFSVLTNSIDESNVIVAGFPAKIIKKNINWSRQTIQEYEKDILKTPPN